MQSWRAFIAMVLVLIAGGQVSASSLPPLDSQLVLNRYATRLLREEGPKVLVFSYTVSQAGPRAIEQAHRIYRSGEVVRDETLMVDGVRQKSIRIARYRNRYTVDNLAPRPTQYAFLFQRYARVGTSLTYSYRAVPLGAPTGFIVDAITIDGKSFLPLEIRFHSTSAGGTSGRGAVAFSRVGKYWVPTTANVEAKIAGKPARERITFSAYQFPTTLPRSTFASPRPLPTPVLPKL